MELKVRQEYINCWDKAFKKNLEQEETMEMIVPDAYADILQVLDSEGMVLLQKKECMSSCIQMQGCIKTDILYSTDTMGEVCCLEACIPFTSKVESVNIMPHSKVIVKPHVHKVDVHLLNPRKILIKVNFMLEVEVFTGKSEAICAGVDEANMHGIEELVKEYESEVTVATMEKTFHYSDFVALPAGHPKVKELMKIQAESVCNESKIIGQKVVMKGEVFLHILYKTTENQLHFVTISVPFSQILEQPDIDEETIESIVLAFQSISCQLMNDEMQSFSVDLELMAQCHFKKIVHVPMLVDLYSVTHEILEEKKDYSVDQMVDEGKKTQEISEKIETNLAVKEVLASKIRPLQYTQSVANGMLMMQADMELYILFETEQGEINSIHRRMQISHESPAEDSSNYMSECKTMKNPSISIYSEGIEVIVYLDFYWKAMGHQTMQGIQTVTMGEPKENDVNCPSVVVRTVKEGDTLWAIAKEYHTTVDEIVLVNALPTKDIYPEQKILIPKRRNTVPMKY